MREDVREGEREGVREGGREGGREKERDGGGRRGGGLRRRQKRVKMCVGMKRERQESEGREVEVVWRKRACSQLQCHL